MDTSPLAFSCSASCAKRPEAVPKNGYSLPRLLENPKLRLHLLVWLVVAYQVNFTLLQESNRINPSHDVTAENLLQCFLSGNFRLSI